MPTRRGGSATSLALPPVAPAAAGAPRGDGGWFNCWCCLGGAPSLASAGDPPRGERGCFDCCWCLGAAPLFGCRGAGDSTTRLDGDQVDSWVGTRIKHMQRGHTTWAPQASITRAHLNLRYTPRVWCERVHRAHRFRCVPGVRHRPRWRGCSRVTTCSRRGAKWRLHTRMWVARIVDSAVRCFDFLGRRGSRGWPGWARWA